MKYATLERLLVRLFKMSESQRSALKGKFKYAMRLGSAEEAARGSGPIHYELDDILGFVLYFQLLGASCRPTIALRWVRTHWNNLESALMAAWQEVADPAGYPTRNKIWAIFPNILAEAGAGESLLDTKIIEPAGEVSPLDLMEWHEPAADADRCGIMIHFPLLLKACCEALREIEPELEKKFRAAMDKKVAVALRSRPQ